MKVVVTGATGFIGQVIVRQLLEAGDEVVVLTRNVAKAAISLGNLCKYYQWEDLDSLPPLEAFDQADGVINLMGETISRRWDEEQKKSIYHSRIDGTKRLVEAFEKLQQKPKVFVSASAIGVYGNRGSEEINETSATGEGFLASVCKDWESEANKAANLGIRVAIIRTGLVIGRNGGALSKMLPVFKLGVGGKMGTGQQYMSWIHVEDLASMYIETLKNEKISGVLNGTAPYPATNAEFTKLMGKVLRRPVFLPAPKVAVKAVLGEMSQLLLEGQKVLPSKFKESHFRYRYPTLEMALKETAY